MIFSLFSTTFILNRAKLKKKKLFNGDNHDNDDKDKDNYSKDDNNKDYQSKEYHNTDNHDKDLHNKDNHNRNFLLLSAHFKKLRGLTYAFFFFKSKFFFSAGWNMTCFMFQSKDKNILNKVFAKLLF